MIYEYKKDQFLRNKISGNIVQLKQDTNKLDLNIWEIWAPRDGEYCWFTNTGDLELNISPHLGNYGVLSYTLDYYDLCEPWTKNLPFGMK